MIVALDGDATVPGGPITGHVRMHALDLIRRSLKGITSCPYEPDMFAKHLEMCILMHARDDYATYSSTIGRVTYNLGSNGEWLLSAVSVSDIPHLSHRRLHEHTAHAELEMGTLRSVQNLLKKAHDAQERFETLAKSEHSDVAIRCPICHTQDNITRMAAQLNHGDEGMRTQCICSCGARWTM
jgi:hypothetical protein